MLKRQGFKRGEWTCIQDQDEFVAVGQNIKELKTESHEQIESIYDNCPIIYNDQVEELKFKIDNRLASELESFTYDKHLLLERIEPEHRPSISGKVLLIIKNDREQITNVLMERDFNDLEIALRDQEKHPHGINVKPKKKLVQRQIVRKICTLLSVKNTLDRDTLISDAMIKFNLDKWKELLTRSKVHFLGVIRDRNQLKSTKEIKNAIDSILKSWSCSALNIVEKKQKVIDGKKFRDYTYCLKASDEFDFYISKCSKLKTKKFNVDPKGNLQNF